MAYAILRNDHGYAIAIERDGLTIVHLADSVEQNEAFIEQIVDKLNGDTTSDLPPRSAEEVLNRLAAQRAKTATQERRGGTATSEWGTAGGLQSEVDVLRAFVRCVGATDEDRDRMLHQAHTEGGAEMMDAIQRAFDMATP